LKLLYHRNPICAQHLIWEMRDKGLELSNELKAELAAILIGDRAQDLAQELIAYGAGRIYLIEDPGLKLYQSDIYARIMADLIEQHKPQILLLGGTAIGMDLAPRVAAKVKTGLTAHSSTYTSKNSIITPV